MERNKYIPAIRLTAVLSIAVGLLVIAGWLFHIEIFKSMSYGLNTMKFNPALCFLLLGGSILSIISKGEYNSIYSNLLSSAILILAGITFSQDILNVNIGIDELFIRDVASSISGKPFPGRMAQTTSFCFMLMAFSLLSLRSTSHLIKTGSQYSLHVVSLISFIALLGYLYNVPGFYKLSFLVSMAVHTAFTLFLVSISASLINPSTGLTSIFTGNEIGNMMARRLFPLVAIIILLLGYLRLESYRMNLVSTDFGIALFAVSFLVLSLLLIANTVKHLNKADSKRSQLELSLRVLNRTLEEKVIERTKDLEVSEGKFHRIFKMSPTGLLLSDLNTAKFLEVNQSFIDMAGYSKEEAEGKTTVELGLISQEEREKIRKTLEKQGYLKNMETYYYTKSGEKRNSLMSVEIIDIRKKKIALTVLYDTTEQKIAEQELKEAKRIAEESSVAKERFMANMSHEIRTPMNAIIGFTNLLEKNKLNEEQGQYLEFIKNSGENLLVLINDILDYSKIEAGMMQLETVPFKIAELLHSIEIMFSEKSKEKNLKLLAEIDTNIPGILVGDPTRLTQILINLIGNAIKFTKEGSVKVTINLLSVQNNQAQIGISVKDTGIGIPEDKLKDIFERFMQASSETTRNYGGTGLGLSIVKKLAEIQKGEITVKSTDGEGTEFYVVLPYAIGKEEIRIDSEATPHREEMKKFEKDLNVLVAEDNLMNQVLARKVLSGFGCHVDIAENGEIAVEMAGNKKYDLILMDIQMPVIDGYTASKKIRSELDQTIPIIAMTAHVMAGEREKCIGFGMTDYISKPFKVEVLYSLISKYTNLVR